MDCDCDCDYDYESVLSVQWHNALNAMHMEKHWVTESVCVQSTDWLKFELELELGTWNPWNLQLGILELGTDFFCESDSERRQWREAEADARIWFLSLPSVHFTSTFSLPGNQGTLRHTAGVRVRAEIRLFLFHDHGMSNMSMPCLSDFILRLSATFSSSRLAALWLGACSCCLGSWGWALAAWHLDGFSRQWGAWYDGACATARATWSIIHGCCCWWQKPLQLLQQRAIFRRSLAMQTRPPQTHVRRGLRHIILQVSKVSKSESTSKYPVQSSDHLQPFAVCKINILTRVQYWTEHWTHWSLNKHRKS